MPSHDMRFATELADLLQLDLFGLFVEEEGLRDLAALPFAREFQPLGGGWRSLDIDQLSRDLELMGKNAERIFAEAAKNLQTACKFEIVRGSMAQTIASTLRAGDIVLIREPAMAADRVTRQFLSIFEAALQSAAAVLLVPGRIARHSGAIVAIAMKPNDPSIEVAKAIAAAAKAELVVVEAFRVGKDNARVDTRSAASGFARLTGAKDTISTLSRIRSALHNVYERLIVISRSDEFSPSAIASLRQVPVLIVEPGQANFDIDQDNKSAA
jgi:ribosomal protein L4